MIKGAIEAVSDDHVSGWLHSDLGPMRGVTVLAFLDKDCVGAGKIEHFRQDLADAGLGDGFAGFNIPIRLPTAKDAPRLTVRLEGSDLTLLAPDARITGHDAVPSVAKRRHAARSPGMLQWMLGRGWLSQPDYDFLKFFDRMGVYERSLLAKAGDGSNDRTLLDAGTVAKNVLDVYAMEDLDISKQQIRNIKEFEPTIARLRENQEILPVVALWAAERGKIGVVEGSHASEAEEAGSVPVQVDYAFGPDRLLIINLDATMTMGLTAPQAQMTVFLGTPRR